MANKKTDGVLRLGANFKPSTREWGLSGTLGLMVSFSMAPAFAHDTALATSFMTTPVVHNVTPVVHTVTPATTHSQVVNTAATTHTVVHAHTSTSSTGSTSSGKTGTTTTNTSTSSTSSSGWTTSHGQTASSSHTNAAVNPTTPEAVNLQSSAATFTLATLGNFKTVTIEVGGKTETVTSTTKLTAAELLAADQALYSTGGVTTQGLVLNSLGEATGGAFTLNNKTLTTLDLSTGGLSSLLIPSKVTFDDKVSILNVAGLLSNYGSIDAQSNSAAGNTIHATNILNAAGATISGTAPLTLTADQTFTNAGTTKSTSDLTINAASLVNSATTSAGHNLNINAPGIVNSGNLTAKNDVNFTSTQSITLQQTSNANVTAGGNINIRDASYNGSGNVQLTGGNLLSQQLNVYAPTGEFGLDVGNVTGQLNGSIGAIHSDTEAPNLVLGNLNITGDPAFYNTGNIVVSGAINDTNGVPLALVAGGSILSAGGSLVTGGGDLTLVAGAKYNTNDGTTAGGPSWTTVITLLGGSATGGSIDLAGGHGGSAAVTAINTSNPGLGNGGNITLAAYAGSTVGSGTVTTPVALTINVDGHDIDGEHGGINGTDLALNGNVQIIAGATSGSAVTIGNIEASTATGGGGVITLQTGAPILTGTLKGTTAVPFQIVNGQPYGTFSSSGTGGGSIQFGAVNGFQALFDSNEVGGSFTTSTSGGVNNTGNITDGGISITTGQNFTQSTTWVSGGTLVSTPGTFTQTASGNVSLNGVGGQYNISAGKTVDFEGIDSAEGGLSPASINVTTAAGGTTYVGLYQVNTAVINADVFTVTGSSVVTVNGTVYRVSGNVPTGSGNITFSNPTGNLTLNGYGTITNSGIFTMSASGNVTVASLIGGETNPFNAPQGWVFNSGGTLTLPFHHLITAPDPTTGNGGTVTLSYNAFSYMPDVNNPTAPFVIQANGGGGTTGNGGIVTITANNTLNQAIGGVANNFQITANSGTQAAASGGQVNIRVGGSLQIDPNYLSTVGTGIGGSVTFTPGTNLIITGNLSEAPTGGSATNYGSINLNVPTGSGAFAVGTAVVPTNGIEGSLTGNVNIVDPTGITIFSLGATPSISGNAINLTSNVITNAGLIMGTNVGTQTSSSVAFNTPSLINNSTGEIGAAIGKGGTSTITVTSPSALIISGTGKWDTTYGYSFNAATSINMGELFNLSQGVGANPAFDQLTLNAGTNLNIASNNLMTDGGIAGKINLTANTVTYLNAATTPFTLIANGSQSGGITVNLTNSAASYQAIGTLAGQYSLIVDTPGPAVGAISFTSATGLIVNTGPDSLNNLNGNLTLSAAGNMSVLGAISQGTGNVTLTSSGKGVNQFLVGTGTTPINGTEGNITGGVITITAPVGLYVEPTASITGTTMAFTTPLFSNYGSLLFPTPAAMDITQISISSTGNLTIAGTGTYATTAAYSFTGANVNLGPLFAIPNTFNSLTINATGTLSLPSTNLLQTANAVGGPNTISINAKSVSYLGQTTSPLTLNASSTEGGGSVTYNLTGTTALNVGNGAGQVVIDVEAYAFASTAIGSITISNGGALTINPNYLGTIGAPGSTNITLGATTGNLLVTGWNANLLGAVGNLTVNANTPNIFVVGVVANQLSGIQATSPITGQSMTITNTLGSIYLASTDILTANASGGSVSLTADKYVYGATGVETIVAPTISLTSTALSVGTAAGPMIVNTPANTTASALTVNSPIGIYVTDNSPGFTPAASMTNPNPVPTLTLNGTAPIFTFSALNTVAPLIDLPTGLPNATTITINAPYVAPAPPPLPLIVVNLAPVAPVPLTTGGLQTEASIGNGLGVVTINVGTGAITENAMLGATAPTPILISATTLALTAGDVVLTLPSTVTYAYNNALQTVESAITYNGSMATTHSIVNNSFFPTSIGAGTTTNFNYLTQGEAVINGVQTSSGEYHVTSWGQLLVNANINSTGAVTLQTVSGGYMGSTNGSVVTGNSVTFDSDYGNIVTLSVNTPTLTLNTGGAVTLTNTYTGANTLSVGPNNPISLSLAVNGQLTLASSITTTNGNIAIQDNNTSTGSITLDPGITVHAVSTVAGLGSVTLTIGPRATVVTAGVTPPGLTVNETGALVYFGSTVFPNGTITALGDNNTANANGRYVVFNSDGRPSAITLLGNDTITGDPPVGATTTTNAALASANSVVNFSSTGSTGSAQGESVIPQTVSLGGGLTNITSALTTSESKETISLSNANNALQSATSTSNLMSSGSAGVNNASASKVDANDGANLLSANLSTVSTAPLTLSSSTNFTGSIAAQAANTGGIVSGNNVSAVTGKPLFGGISAKHHLGSHSTAVEHQTLDNRAVILSPEHAMTVDTKFGKVDIAAKSLVILVATDKSLSVYNFHDDSHKAVVVTAHGAPLEVYPGRHITVSKASEEGFETVNPALFIPHRGMKSIVSGDVKIFSSEFSVQNAVNGFAPLKAKFTSNDTEWQKMATKVFKTTALLQVLSHNQEEFEYFAPKPLTAYAK
jgi:hypothetical protein